MLGLIRFEWRFIGQGYRLSCKMTSTTDVLMSFLGDLDNEPDFFFPDHDDVDNGIDLNNFDGGESISPFCSRTASNSKLDQTLGDKVARLPSWSESDGIRSRKHSVGENDYSFSTSPSSVEYECIELPYEMTQIIDDDGKISSSRVKRERPHITHDSTSESVRSTKMPRLRRKKDKLKVKKSKLTAEEKMQSLVQILKNMRKTVDPPAPEVVDDPATGPERQLESSFSMAEDFLLCIFSGKCLDGCTPVHLNTCVEPNASLYVPALASLFSLAQYKRSESNLTAWAPVSDGIDIFPERHMGVGQIAAASRCFARTLSDLITENTYKSTEASVVVKRTAMSHGKQLITPFIWKCRHTGVKSGGIEFSGLIRCTLGPSKFSFVHISFDAFTIIRQCEQMTVTSNEETSL